MKRTLPYWYSKPYHFQEQAFTEAAQDLRGYSDSERAMRLEDADDSELESLVDLACDSQG